MVVVAHGMQALRGNPQILSTGLGTVERVNHLRGYELVIASVDEQHGEAAFFHLFER